jgi:hypothetical protein
MTWQEWIRRVRHDLIKRVLWPARDRRDMGGPVVPGELVVGLLADEEGQPVPPQDLWAQLRREAPGAHPGLARLQVALMRSLRAAERDDLQGVLELESTFEQLAMEIAGKEK